MEQVMTSEHDVARATIPNRGRRVFFALNSQSSSEWTARFLEIAAEFELEPFFYEGVGRRFLPDPGQSNTVDREIVEDLYAAHIVIFYFGAPRAGSDHQDHWVLHHLQ